MVMAQIEMTCDFADVFRIPPQLCVIRPASYFLMQSGRRVGLSFRAPVGLFGMAGVAMQGIEQFSARWFCGWNLGWCGMGGEAHADGEAEGNPKKK